MEFKMSGIIEDFMKHWNLDRYETEKRIKQLEDAGLIEREMKKKKRNSNGVLSLIYILKK
jgi:DNA-binding MarR family transcriptional regulator